MNQGQTVFAQLFQFISHNDVYRFVDRYEGDRRVRNLSCWEQFLAMSFAQLTRRESLRDIEVSLAAHRRQLYHAGFRSAVKRSTLADANEKRDWRIYSDLAQHLIQQARPLRQSARTGRSIGQKAIRPQEPADLSVGTRSDRKNRQIYRSELVPTARTGRSIGRKPFRPQELTDLSVGSRSGLKN